MINMFGRWLREAGIKIPTDEAGNVTGTIEISPLYALNAEELKEKIGQPDGVLAGKKIVFTGELNLQWVSATNTSHIYLY